MRTASAYHKMRRRTAKYLNWWCRTGYGVNWPWDVSGTNNEEGA